MGKASLDSLMEEGSAFVRQWTAHEKKLEAGFGIYQDKVIIVKVNEQAHPASGCSIDKLLHFIKTSEKKYNVRLLDRMLVAYESETGLRTAHAAEIKELLSKGILNGNTPVYNTSAATDEELQNWKKPLKETWLSKYLQKA